MIPIIIAVVALTEVASVASAALLLSKVNENIMKLVADKGFLLDTNKAISIDKELHKGDKERSTTQNIFDGICALIPGYTSYHLWKDTKKEAHKIISNAAFNDALTEMTPIEKEEYNSIKGTSERILYCYRLLHTEPEDVANALKKMEEEKGEKVGIGYSPIICGHGLVSIYPDKISPNYYTLEEIKKMNEPTTFSYIVGKLDGKNTAIIGIPEIVGEINEVQLRKENYSVKHKFVPMNEEQAKDLAFTVYPFTSYKINEINDVITKIHENRKRAMIEEDLRTIEIERASKTKEEELKRRLDK